MEINENLYHWTNYVFALSFLQFLEYVFAKSFLPLNRILYYKGNSQFSRLPLSAVSELTRVGASAKCSDMRLR